MTEEEQRSLAHFLSFYMFERAGHGAGKTNMNYIGTRVWNSMLNAGIAAWLIRKGER